MPLTVAGLKAHSGHWRWRGATCRPNMPWWERSWSTPRWFRQQLTDVPGRRDGRDVLRAAAREYNAGHRAEVEDVEWEPAPIRPRGAW